MANGDVHDDVSDQYLQQFDRSVGVSGQQKLQSFPALQNLGYNGQLASIKNDFHGVKDFNNQMNKYSSVSHTLRIAWTLIKYIAPNNPSISPLLFSSPGMGTVGTAFKSIHGFGQVFALSPSDLKSPAAVNSKASVYSNQSTQASVVTNNSPTTTIGGGAGQSSSGNTSMLNGLLIVGLPTEAKPFLKFDGVNIVWDTAEGGGGVSTIAALTDVQLSSLTDGQFLSYELSSGKWRNVDAPSGGSSALSALTDVLLATPTDGQVLTYNTSVGKWENADATGGGGAVSSVAGRTGAVVLSESDIADLVTDLAGKSAVGHTHVESDITGLVSDLAGKSNVGHTHAESDVTGLVSDLVSLASSISSISSSLSNYQLLSGKDANSGYAGLTSGGLLKTAEFPAPTSSTFGGIKSLAAVTHQFLTSIGTNGIPVAAQPAAADLSDGLTGTGTVIMSSTINRTTVTKTTASLANLAVESGVVTISKGFKLLKVQTDRAARVRLYNTTAQRDADVARAITASLLNDPYVGTAHGVIMDLQTSGAVTFDLSPKIIGANTESSPSSSIAYNITNVSGGTNTVAVTFTYVADEV